MKKIVGILFLQLLIIGLCALDVSGQQSGIWTLDNSPYYVIGDITIPSNASLEINPGVEVLFTGDYQITAEGILIAEGNQDEIISFKSSNDEDAITHQGIRLEYEGTETNSFDYCFFKNAENAINSIDSPANITNSHFTHNDEAIHIFAIGNTNPPEIHIEGNLIENSVKSGILIAESSNVMIVNNEITANGTGPQFRGAIQVSIQTTGMPVTPTITENNIHNNHYQGITCVDMFSSNGINAQIFDNIIAENYTGVYFYNCSGTLYDNQIINNHIDGDMNSGAGVMCYGSGATPYIAGNLISGNYGGIYLTISAQPIIGAPEMNHPYAYGLNTIQDNIDVNGNNNSVILNNISSSINILAKNNYWGTEVTSEIDQTIYDSNDNPSLGTVVYDPIASENEEYTLTLNITSEYPGSPEYIIHIKDLNTSEVTDYVLESIEEATVITFTEATDFTITGTIAHNNDWFSGYCYYGPFDELTIVSLNDDNTSESVDLAFTAEARPNTFRTYDYININGNDVLPLLKDEFYTDQVKQLVYENDNNDIMLVGYQKYGINGWENVLFDEEYLYLDNDAQDGDTFTNYQVSLIDNIYQLYANGVEVIGTHDQEIESNTVMSKAIHKVLDSPWDMETSTWIEYTGNSAPLSVNTRIAGDSDFIATDTQYSEDFNQNKLINLQANMEINYQTSRGLDNPTNLIKIDERIYWNPGIDILHYLVAWYHESEVDTLHYHMLDPGIINCDIADIGLPEGISVVSVVGYTLFALTYTAPTNSIEINNIVDNVSNDVAITKPLLSNYPNPFNPETTISFTLPKSGNVSLDIYNIKGQKVKSLLKDYHEAGQHSVVWDGRDDKNKPVASGIYLYKMKSGTYSSNKKMILLK